MYPPGTKSFTIKSWDSKLLEKYCVISNVQFLDFVLYFVSARHSQVKIKHLFLNSRTIKAQISLCTRGTA